MNPASRNLIIALLKKDNTVHLGQDPRAAFIELATWGDRIRDVDHPGHGASPSFDANPHYLGIRNWHFVDIEYHANGKASQQEFDSACFGHPPLVGKYPGFHVATAHANSKACVFDKILQFETTLADKNAPVAERLQALKFLVHFVGDIHQPLHAAEHHGDQGGNCVITVGGKLHSYWDTKLVHDVRAQRSNDDTATMLEGELPSDTSSLTNASPKDWAFESYEIASTKAYALGIANLRPAVIRCPRSRFRRATTKRARKPFGRNSAKPAFASRQC